MDISTSPSAPDSEQGVIACCLAEEDGIHLDECLALGLRASDFYTMAHQEMFSALIELREDQKQIHEINLLEYLSNAGSKIVPIDIINIQNRVEVASLDHTKQFAKTVIEKAKLRKLQRNARETIEKCSSGNMSPDEICAQTESFIIELNQDDEEDASIRAAATELEDDLKAMINGTYERQGFRFDVPSIDMQMDSEGLAPGTVTYISAPTSVGKSQLALNVAMRLGVSYGEPLAYFSYEMLAKQLSKRMVQTASGVNINRFRDGSVNAQEQKVVSESLQKIKAAPIYTNHSKKRVEDMSSLVRQWKRKHGVKIVFIDYLQKMHSHSNKMSSVESIAYNSGRIKDLALELELPIVVLSQVNREAVKNLEFKPERGLYVHDMIGGSAIENDADNILMFWPELGDAGKSRVTDEQGRGYVNLKATFAKQREGTRYERFDLLFKEYCGRFQ